MQPTQRKVKPAHIPDGPFVALDFETADRGSDSACAVALMRVEGAAIVERRTCLIRPPRRWFTFTYIHGIAWHHVHDQPTFADLWPALAPMLDGAAFLAAHNASFDRRVLQSCCDAAQLPAPLTPFLCTVHLSRRTWKLRSAKLPDVCAHLGLPLRHHDPSSDAEACARIVIAARGAISDQSPVNNDRATAACDPPTTITYLSERPPY